MSKGEIMSMCGEMERKIIGKNTKGVMFIGGS